MVQSPWEWVWTHNACSSTSGNNAASKIGRDQHALYKAGRAYLYEPLGPLGAMREYPYGDDGAGDIDSGPLIFGRGVSATAFAIGAARADGDADTAAALLRTATMFGAPSEDPGGALHFRSAGAAMCGSEVG